MLEALRRKIARAIIIDRATGKSGFVNRIARERSEENYRFAARFVAGKTVLDIGGGTGIGHDLLLAANPRRILSLDKKIVPEGKAAHRDPRLEYRRGDFLQDDPPGSPFEILICLGTLFYLADHGAALGKMRRLLRPGGVLLVNCINRDLIGRFFGMQLQDIDAKFSGAYGASEFAALLERHFGAEPALYVQQPVPAACGTIRLWAAAAAWPFARHPVLPKTPDTEGMFNYAVVAA